ncbi:MAG: SprT family zinc-dependent metalloprotease [Verrucomicrobiales bacterium]
MSRERELAYEVIRSQRRTADIVIEPDGRVVVRAPSGVSEECIEDMVRAKQAWIYKNLAEWRDLNSTRVFRDYRNGEGFMYLGRSYRLLLVAGSAAPLQLRNGRFWLSRDIVEDGGEMAARLAFQSYLSIKGLEWISKRVHYYAPKAGVEPGRIDIRELKNRWASCAASRNLVFHWKCMMAPAKIIDYIVVHELCHFHYLDHSTAFWNELDKILPDYRERKDWLAKNGASLDL